VRRESPGAAGPGRALGARPGPVGRRVRPARPKRSQRSRFDRTSRKHSGNAHLFGTATTCKVSALIRNHAASALKRAPGKTATPSSSSSTERVCSIVPAICRCRRSRTVASRAERLLTTRTRVISGALVREEFLLARVKHSSRSRGGTAWCDQSPSVSSTAATSSCSRPRLSNGAPRSMATAGQHARGSAVAHGGCPIPLKRSAVLADPNPDAGGTLAQVSMRS
jgi:hypothetical protein